MPKPFSANDRSRAARPLQVQISDAVLASKTAKRPVVLVVDDEAIIADTRSTILASWGYPVLKAYSAEEALILARTIKPDLLLSDILLTGMHGVDLAIELREMAPHCKVLLFSGMVAGEGLLEMARLAGRDFTLIPKPVHPEELRLHLEELEANLLDEIEQDEIKSVIEIVPIETVPLESARDKDAFGTTEAIA